MHISPGFTGPLCEENIDDCHPKPCHHGECKDGIATFTCKCYLGYMGRICSEQIKECHSDPCQNGGRCIDLVNKYQCICQPGTSGKPWHKNTHMYTYSIHICTRSLTACLFKSEAFPFLTNSTCSSLFGIPGLVVNLLHNEQILNGHR